MPAELQDAHENQVPVSLVPLMNKISASIVLAPFCLPCAFMLTIFNHGVLSYFFLFNSPICMHLYILSCNTLSLNLHIIVPISLPLPILCDTCQNTLNLYPFCISVSTNCCNAHSKIAKESIIPREQRASICESSGRTRKQTHHCGPGSPPKITCWWRFSFLHHCACSRESRISPLVFSALKTSRIT